MADGVDGARKQLESQLGSQSNQAGGDTASKHRTFGDRSGPVGAGRTKGAGVWLAQIKKPTVVNVNPQAERPTVPDKRPDILPGGAQVSAEHPVPAVIAQGAPPAAGAEAVPAPPSPTATSPTLAAPAPASPAPSKFERFKAWAWEFGKETAALDVEVGAHLLQASGVVSEKKADEVVDHAYKELGVDKDASTARALSLAAREKLKELPGEMRQKLVNAGGAIVEGEAKVLEAAGAVDEKKTEAWIDRGYAAHDLKREDNDVRKAVVGAAHYVADKAEEAALVDLELNIRAGVAAHIIDPAAGKKAVDEAYKAAGLTRQDNTFREFGKTSLQFAVDVEKIKTGTEAGAAILLLRQLRDKGKISPATAAGWEAKISAVSKLDPEQAVRIAKDSRRTAADAVVFATGVALETLSPIENALGQSEAERTEFFDLLQKDIGGSKSRTNEITAFAEDKLLPALDMVAYTAIDGALRGLKVPPPVAAAIAGAAVQAANSLGNNESWADTLFDASVAAGENALASVAVGKFAEALRARVLAQALLRLDPAMRAAYYAGDKAIKEMIDKGVQQATQTAATALLGNIADQATRLPIRLTETLIAHTYVGPDRKAHIDPQWKKQAIREFGQAAVNVAVGQVVHSASKGLSLDQIKAKLITQDPVSQKPASPERVSQPPADQGRTSPTGSRPAVRPQFDSSEDWSNAVEQWAEGNLADKASVPRAKREPLTGGLEVNRVDGRKLPLRPQPRLDIQDLPLRPGESPRQALARVRSIIGTRISDHPVLRQAWDQARTEALKNRRLAESDRPGTGTRAVRRGRFDLATETFSLFWRNVQRAPAASKIFTDAGFELPGRGRGAVLIGVGPGIPIKERTVSLDRIQEQAQQGNGSPALDADNIRFEFHQPKYEREAIQQRHPELRPRGGGAGDEVNRRPPAAPIDPQTWRSATADFQDVRNESGTEPRHAAPSNEAPGPRRSVGQEDAPAASRPAGHGERSAYRDRVMSTDQSYRRIHTTTGGHDPDYTFVAEFRQAPGSSDPNQIEVTFDNESQIKGLRYGERFYDEVFDHLDRTNKDVRSMQNVYPNDGTQADNYLTFQKVFAATGDTAEAAFATHDGKMAIRHGLTKVTVEENNHEKVVVRYAKPDKPSPLWITTTVKIPADMFRANLASGMTPEQAAVNTSVGQIIKYDGWREAAAYERGDPGATKRPTPFKLKNLRLDATGNPIATYSRNEPISPRVRGLEDRSIAVHSEVRRATQAEAGNSDAKLKPALEARRFALQAEETLLRAELAREPVSTSEALRALDEGTKLPDITAAARRLTAATADAQNKLLKLGTISKATAGAYASEGPGYSVTASMDNGVVTLALDTSGARGIGLEAELAKRALRHFQSGPGANGNKIVSLNVTLKAGSDLEALNQQLAQKPWRSPGPQPQALLDLKLKQAARATPLGLLAHANGLGEPHVGKQTYDAGGKLIAVDIAFWPQQAQWRSARRIGEPQPALPH